jgi:hypothetical protein
VLPADSVAVPAACVEVVPADSVAVPAACVEVVPPAACVANQNLDGKNTFCRRLLAVSSVAFACMQLRNLCEEEYFAGKHAIATIYGITYPVLASLVLSHSPWAS